MSARPIEITSADTLDFDVTKYDWAFERENAGAISAHWTRLVKQRPQMFDGRVLLMHRGAVETAGGRRILRGAVFETAFSAFLAWRDLGFPGESVRNIFAMAALRGADGGFVLGEMGAHTSNAGQIYFPAGTPDTGDISGSRLDLDGSLWRELAEETGLARHEIAARPGWTLVSAGARLACLKIVEAALPARDLVRRIEKRNAAQGAPEFTRMHIVRSRADFRPAAMPDFVVAFLEANQPG